MNLLNFSFGEAIRKILAKGMEYQNTADCRMAYIVPPMVEKLAWTALRQQGRPIVKSINSDDKTITLVNGAVIHVVGADNLDKLRGLKLHFVAFDEGSV